MGPVRMGPVRSWWMSRKTIFVPSIVIGRVRLDRLQVNSLGFAELLFGPGEELLDETAKGDDETRVLDH